jgi:DNA-directed RNA polymerase subunit M/transcription elongation factor TFIIS
MIKNLNPFKFIKDYLKEIENRKIQKIERIKSDLDILKVRSQEISDEYNEGVRKKISDSSKCSKCGSLNVIDRISRLQGSLDGDLSGSQFFGFGSISGSLRGELDTNEVNQCRDCGHQWKKYSPNWEWSDSVLKDRVEKVYYALNYNKDLKMVKFDPMDLKEKFKSLSDKKADIISSIDFYKKHMKIFEDISIDTFIYLSKEHLSEWQLERMKLDKDFLVECGFKK